MIFPSVYIVCTDQIHPPFSHHFTQHTPFPVSSNRYSFQVVFVLPHLKDSMWYLSFCVWLFSLNIKFSSPFCCNDRIPPFFMANNISLCIYTTYCLFHSSVDGHIGWFCILALINSVIINLGMQVFNEYAGFISSGYILRSGIARSYGKSVFSFLKNLCTVLHNGYTNFHSFQECTDSFFSTSLSAF